MLSFLLFIPLLLGSVLPADTQAVLGSAAELKRSLRSGLEAGALFSFEAKVVSPSQELHPMTVVKDRTGSVEFYDIMSVLPGRRPQAGDVIRISGHTKRAGYGTTAAIADTVTVVRHEDPVRPVAVSASQILRGDFDLTPVTVEGVVRDVFCDEIDLYWVYLVLQCGSDTLYVTFGSSTPTLFGLDRLVGARVSVSGTPHLQTDGARRMLKGLVSITGPEAVVSLGGGPEDPFAAPPLESENAWLSAKGTPFGRRTAEGRVIAVWNGNSALIRTADKRVVGVRFTGLNTPACGTVVRVSGFPETDLFRLNLSCATWCASDMTLPPEPEALPVTTAMLWTTPKGNPGVNATYHGQPLRLRGVVLDRPDRIGDLINVNSDGTTVRLNIGAIPTVAEDLAVGSLVEFTGTCVMDMPNWHPDAPFPHIREVMIVARTPADIIVLRRPPWWTPARLSVVIGSLLLVLLGILIWNRTLRTVAERRGHELLREKLGHVKSEMKTQERTRLAVELHDSLAQSLTGAAMEIEAAEGLKGDAPPDMLAHLDLAAKTITSCRIELRNCLWDLRSRALEEPDMTTAIIRTLQPHINDSRLSVRFNMPRSRLTDNSAHALLRIIRELVLNALRHGKASAIRVAGSMDGDTLKFSVRDNGCGFDPDDHPGVLQGHFGLQGVRERVRQLGGRLSIDSAPGAGTKVTVHIRLTPPDADSHQQGPQT